MQQVMKQRKPIIERITKRYEQAHKVDCKNCKLEEKVCIVKSYMSKNDKCIWFKNKKIKGEINEIIVYFKG